MSPRLSITLLALCIVALSFSILSMEKRIDQRIDRLEQAAKAQGLINQSQVQLRN